MASQADTWMPLFYSFLGLAVDEGVAICTSRDFYIERLAGHAPLFRSTPKRHADSDDVELPASSA